MWEDRLRHPISSEEQITCSPWDGWWAGDHSALLLADLPKGRVQQLQAFRIKLKFRAK